MHWMGETVGPQGRVVGIDKNTKHLQGMDRSPWHIIEGDLFDSDFGQGFDLAHGRYVLVHNTNDMAILKKIHDRLKPGGLALFEEPDFRSPLDLNNPMDRPVQRVNRGICSMYTKMGLDPAYGLRLPEKLCAAGYEIVEVDAALHLCPGNSPIAKMMAASTDALREKYLATGEAQEADLEAYIANAFNPEYWSIYYTTVSVLARAIKPHPDGKR